MYGSILRGFLKRGQGSAGSEGAHRGLHILNLVEKVARAANRNVACLSALCVLLQALTMTLSLWKEIRSHMAPTAECPHYRFNMHELSRLVQVRMFAGIA